MIEVVYDGNLGNNLFQYSLGRILAEKLGFKLSANPIPGFSGTFDEVDGLDFSTEPDPIICSGQFLDQSLLLNERPQKKIILKGYFQRLEYYIEHTSEIKNKWAKQDLVLTEDVSKEDLIVGIRRGRDYIPHFGIPLSYYEEAISKFNFRNMWISTNEPDDPFIRYFVKKYNARIRPPNALDNLAFLQMFDQIVISNSTFLWWGAFLSCARKIISPVPMTGLWSPSDPVSAGIELRVQEDRYVHLPCREPYRSINISETITNKYIEARRALPLVIPAVIWRNLRNIKSMCLGAGPEKRGKDEKR